MKIKKESKLNISPAWLTFPLYSREHFLFFSDLVLLHGSGVVLSGCRINTY